MRYDNRYIIVVVVLMDAPLWYNCTALSYSRLASKCAPDSIINAGVDFKAYLINSESSRLYTIWLINNMVVDIQYW